MALDINACVSEGIARVRRAGDPDILLETFADLNRGFGYDGYILHIGAPDRNLDARGDCPEAWLREYRERGYLERDPRRVTPR